MDKSDFMDKNYVTIMVESLEKKRNLLRNIAELNRQQLILLDAPNLSPEEFEQNIEYKGSMITELNLLDEGFAKLFDRIGDTLKQNSKEYASEISRMKELIKEITDLGNTIQTQEVRNKKKAEAKFESVRGQVRNVRNSQKVVKQYYQSMTKQHGVVGGFDDKK